MKTTLDIPDVLFRKVKARAALEGRPMRDFVVEALGTKLQTATGTAAVVCEPAWKRCFGSLRKQHQALHAVQATVDREFETVNPDEWK